MVKNRLMTVSFVTPMMFLMTLTVKIEKSRNRNEVMSSEIEVMLNKIGVMWCYCVRDRCEVISICAVYHYIRT